MELDFGADDEVEIGSLPLEEMTREEYLGLLVQCRGMVVDRSGKRRRCQGRTLPRLVDRWFTHGFCPECWARERAKLYGG